jgi:N-acetylmuramic acid 6-phosphate (MurNAc-6-P) etherase
MSEAGGDLRVALVMNAKQTDAATALESLEQNDWVVEKAVVTHK